MQQEQIFNHQEIKKIKQEKMIIQDSGSDWSLSSLQDINGQNIKDLLEDQNDNDQQHKIKKLQQKLIIPQKPLLNEKSSINQIGIIINYVGGLMIIQSNNSNIVVDLDNWICSENKQLIGFIIDVLGKIQSPYYVIKCLNNEIQQRYIIGSKLYYLEGSRVLKQQDLSSMKSKKAIDNQNIEKQQESSDQRSNKSQQKDKRYFKRRQQYSQQHRPQRSRTRQNYRQRRNRNPNQQTNRNNQLNQAYLQGVYSAYFQQMMQLQNGNLTNFHPRQ